MLLKLFMKFRSHKGDTLAIFALGYPVVKVFEHVLSRVNRSERLRLGTETFPARSNPRLVIMGPSDFVDTPLERAPKSRRRDLRRPTPPSQVR